MGVNLTINHVTGAVEDKKVNRSGQEWEPTNRTAVEGVNTSRKNVVVKNDLQCKIRGNNLSIKITELAGKSQILLYFMTVKCDGAKTGYAACKTCLVLKVMSLCKGNNC